MQRFLPIPPLNLSDFFHPGQIYLMHPTHVTTNKAHAFNLSLHGILIPSLSHPSRHHAIAQCRVRHGKTSTMCGVLPSFAYAYSKTFRQHEINDNGPYTHKLIRSYPVFVSNPQRHCGPD